MFIPSKTTNKHIRMIKKIYCAVFYNENEKEIGRKTYSSYGRLVTYGYKRGKKIGAKCFFHVEYLRRFKIDVDDCTHPYADVVRKLDREECMRCGEVLCEG